MRHRVLPVSGIAMPVIYGLMLFASCSLAPWFDVLHSEPSELGQANAAYPMVYNFGRVATAVAGLLAGGALIRAMRTVRCAIWNILAGVTILFASVGLATAGLFPLPSPLHYGFGLTAFGVLTPLFGAILLRSLGERSAVALLLVLFLLIAVLVGLKAPPILPAH